MGSPLSKEYILKHASEDELWALFHTFKEYLIEFVGLKDLSITDKNIGDAIAKLQE